GRGMRFSVTGVTVRKELAEHAGNGIGPRSVSLPVSIATHPGELMSQTRVAILVGSLRADSLNRKLAEKLRDQAPDGITVDIVDGLENLPFYNEDVDNGSAPEAADHVRR